MSNFQTAKEAIDNLTSEVIKWKYGIASAELKAEQHKALQVIHDIVSNKVIGKDEPEINKSSKSPYAGGVERMTRNEHRKSQRNQLNKAIWGSEKGR